MKDNQRKHFSFSGAGGLKSSRLPSRRFPAKCSRRATDSATVMQDPYSPRMLVIVIISASAPTTLVSVIILFGPQLYAPGISPHSNPHVRCVCDVWLNYHIDSQSPTLMPSLGRPLLDGKYVGTKIAQVRKCDCRADVVEVVLKLEGMQWKTRMLQRFQS